MRLSESKPHCESSPQAKLGSLGRVSWLLQEEQGHDWPHWLVDDRLAMRELCMCGPH